MLSLIPLYLFGSSFLLKLPANNTSNALPAPFRPLSTLSLGLSRYRLAFFGYFSGQALIVASGWHGGARDDLRLPARGDESCGRTESVKRDEKTILCSLSLISQRGQMNKKSHNSPRRWMRDFFTPHPSPPISCLMQGKGPGCTTWVQSLTCAQEAGCNMSGADWTLRHTSCRIGGVAAVAATGTSNLE
jgi:hypothetical protein